MSRFFVSGAEAIGKVATKMKNTHFKIPISKLFKGFSFFDDHPDLGAVRFEWFVKGRPEPVAPYEGLIRDFHRLDGEARGEASEVRG